MSHCACGVIAVLVLVDFSSWYLSAGPISQSTEVARVITMGLMNDVRGDGNVVEEGNACFHCQNALFGDGCATSYVRVYECVYECVHVCYARELIHQLLVLLLLRAHAHAS